MAGLAVLWIACMAYFSLRHLVRHAGAGTAAHRIEHAAAFGFLGLLVLPLSRNRVQEWMLALTIAALAATLELAQHLIFRNTVFEWWDVRDDSIGVLFAWLVVRSIRRNDA